MVIVSLHSNRNLNKNHEELEACCFGKAGWRGSSAWLYTSPIGLETYTAMLRLCGCWEFKFRSSHLHRKHFSHGAILSAGWKVFFFLYKMTK